jgi:large subunit ribosomal protein L9
MEVILTKDVDRLGQAGEIVRVKPGYARNFLIPRGLALLATRGNRSLVEHHRRTIAREQERIRAERRVLADTLANVSVSIARKVGKDGKLFGSVTSKDIAVALEAQNVQLDRKLIQLDEPLRSVGTYEVPVRFGADISTVLKVNVVGI